MIIGTFLAFLFEYTNLPFKKAFRALSFLPFLIPPYILAIAWIIFLGAEKAYLNFNLPLSIYNSQTAVFILTLAFFPLVTLIVLFSLRNVDRNLEESARLFYAQNKVLRKITLPLIAPHVLMAGFFVFVPEKSRFAAFAARMDLIDNLPKTKQRASVIFDFPDPFGPTITFIAFSKGISVFLAKDLKPCITIFLM